MARATSPIYNVPFRRRREGRTRYKKRFAMLKSRKPRLVVRKTNRDIVVHLVSYAPEGDLTRVRVNKKELEKYGWIVKRNTPTAYLYGLLLAKKALEKGFKEAILDIGLHTPTKNSLVFAVAQGARDGGLEINLGTEVEESRINGTVIANYAKTLKETNPSEYNKKFSLYIKKGIAPEKLNELFEKVKKKIEG